MADSTSTDVSMPIFDLHCDLLMSLQEDATCTPFDPKLRCSVPQLRAGRVAWQILPIFVPTGQGSARIGWEQAEIFRRLSVDYASEFVFSGREVLNADREGRVQVFAAVENASGFCDEAEPLQEGLDRLALLQASVGPLVYISLTWKHENRFGGGDRTQVGLKPDGRELLRFMSGRRIAVDLSHASDWLAHDIFELMDQEELNLPVMASHSNFRAVTRDPRNLPDDLAMEIFVRGGIVGLNVIQRFVGVGCPGRFVDHVEHGLYLRGGDQLAFGADFFCTADLPPGSTSKVPYYFDEYSDASKYPDLVSLCVEPLSGRVEGFASQNARKFIEEQILAPIEVGA